MLMGKQCIKEREKTQTKEWKRRHYADLTEMKKAVREHHEHLYANKSDSLDEMEQFL